VVSAADPLWSLNDGSCEHKSMSSPNDVGIVNKQHLELFASSLTKGLLDNAESQCNGENGNAY
jgi:hypothetical protein